MRRGLFRLKADGCPVTPASSAALHCRLAKISVIGAGNVGMAIAHTILTQNLADVIALPDNSAARRSTCSTPPPSSRASASSPAQTPPSPRTPTSSSSRPGQAYPGSTCCRGTFPCIARSCCPWPSTPGGAAASSLQPRRRAHLRRSPPPSQPRHRLWHQPRLLPLQVPHRQAPQRQHVGRAGSGARLAIVQEVSAAEEPGRQRCEPVHG